MTQTYPINEIFGPTIQGEGPMAGMRCFFVRFAGCDYDCSWCDTKYAVNPKYKGWFRQMMPASAISEGLTKLGARTRDWIVLSGGNPALFVDDSLAADLGDKFSLAMETQGSARLDPLVGHLVDCLVVSPKPPSSMMDDRYDEDIVFDMIAYRHRVQYTALKYVVFDHTDLEWAAEKDASIRSRHSPAGTSHVRSFLSVGTLQGATTKNDLRLQVCDAMAWIYEYIRTDTRFSHFAALPQLHTLAWGNVKGV
jgi:7-carboxy-7-deazaguanine synthase